MTEQTFPLHVVAVIGGAVAGSEAAKILAEKGIGVVVFDQNDRPYGKIEEGLPRWHDKMRIAEFQRIDEAYQHPNVQLIPCTRIGRDISFEDLTTWGFSSIILANGAWRDRPLGIEDIDDYIGKGFYYQNSFMTWFNHSSEKEYQGPVCEIAEGGIVIGGGLASIDVVKVLMLEMIYCALQKRGIDVDINTLERRGADTILQEKELTFESLDVKPCTLFYRRSLAEMPLVSYPENATEEEKQKIEKTRGVLLNRAMKRYFFKVEGNVRPIKKLVEGDRLVGIRFIRTETKNGKLVDIDASEFDIFSKITISSIGSIPEPIAGIPHKGELYDWGKDDSPRLDVDTPVYGLGNVVTGKGNIAVSRKHSKEVANYVSQLEETPPLSVEDFQKLNVRIKSRQKKVGYNGNYSDWIKCHLPLDLQTF